MIRRAYRTGQRASTKKSILTSIWENPPRCHRALLEEYSSADRLWRGAVEAGLGRLAPQSLRIGELACQSRSQNFRVGSCVDGSRIARILTATRLGQVQSCVRPYMRRTLSRRSRAPETTTAAPDLSGMFAPRTGCADPPLCPIVRGGTGPHTDQSRSLFLEEGQNLASSQLPADHPLARGIEGRFPGRPLVLSEGLGRII